MLYHKATICRSCLGDALFYNNADKLGLFDLVWSLMMKKVMLLLASVGLLASQASFAAPDRKGEDVYKAVCAMCHGAGVAGAPKFGDKAAWKARIAQGTPVLYDHALKGIRAMPAKGTCAACTEKEIKNAVDYMVSKAK